MSTIIVGVDGSPRSEDAVALARRLGAERVIVAHAFPYDDAPNRAANLVYRKALEEDAQALVERLGNGLETRTIADWSAARALHRLAEETRAELIVVGSTHTGHLGRVVPGATAERLLHGAPCAVAVAPDGYRTRADAPLRRVGAAYDGSAESGAAVAGAAAVARAEGAALELIRVWPAERYALLYTDGDLGAAVRDELEEAAARAGGEPVYIEGDPAQVLVERTRELDLIVVGSRGYGPLRAVLLGGVSGRLSRHAHCPAIVVPRGVEAPLGALFSAAAA
jgi:nucleotide-binding universal stress UspA family protein